MNAAKLKSLNTDQHCERRTEMSFQKPTSTEIANKFRLTRSKVVVPTRVSLLFFQCLRFTAGTEALSAALPCAPPGPLAAEKRSPHHPWGQELCCAGPPVCLGPDSKKCTGKLFSGWFPLFIICEPWVELYLTCVVRIMLYRSSLGAGAGLGSGAGAGGDLLTKVSCLMLPLRLLVLDLGSEESSALWSSSRRA